MKKEERRKIETVKFDPALHAISKESLPVKREIDEDELIGIKAEHFDKAMALTMKEEEKKRFVDVINADIKALKKSLQVLTARARRGYEEELTELYLVPDHDTNRMLYVDNNRVVQMTRRLRPDEKNATIYEVVSKTGTDKK